MPIKIPNGLPARDTISGENIFVMDETRASTQEIRPLEIAILNLMPTKIDTETQLLRLLGNTPLQVEVELLNTKTHRSKNTSADHLLKITKKAHFCFFCFRFCDCSLMFRFEQER